MKRLGWKTIPLLIAIATVTVSDARSHTPVEVEILRPKPGETVRGSNIDVSLRADAVTPLRASVVVEIRLDGEYVDSSSGRVRAKPSPLGNLILVTGETKTISVKGVQAGPHELAVSYNPHAGEREVIVERKFSVGRNNTGFAVAGIVLLAGLALTYVLTARKRHRTP